MYWEVEKDERHATGTHMLAEPSVSLHAQSVGVVPNSLQDIGRASDGAKRRPVKAEGWAGA
jgi:hypothetical protein